MDRPWLKHYPKGVLENIDPNLYDSIVDVFDEAIKTYADRDSFVNMGTAISFTELDELSSQFACFLQKQCKIKKGDRIAIQMPNLLQFPIVLFGALKAGAIVVNTNPLYTAREMKHQFCDSGAKAIVILANFAHMLEEIVEDTDIETVVVTELGDMLSFPKNHLINLAVKHIKKMVPAYNLPKALSFNQAMKIGESGKYNKPELKHEDIAFLQYTGGTTGVAKGAMLTHKNIVSNMLQVGEWIKPKVVLGQETIITALPLYHIFSLTVNSMCFLRAGATNLLITNPRDIPGFIKTLKNNHFTFMSGVNTLYNALLNHPEFPSINFKQFKIGIAGGMALQKNVAERWLEATKTPIIEGFGLTETSPVACCNPADGTDRVGTIGLPLPSTDIKVVDDDGNDLAIGEEGEICIRGPQVMKGYWERPGETANVMHGEWLKTGDVAVIDSTGFAKIVDRKKDMILVSGFNVFPNEVEDIATTHDDIVEAAAIGIADERSGELVKLFVVKKPGSSITAEQVIAHCKEDLVAYKVPKHVEFREELPKTNVGKILRRELRES